VGLFDLCAAAAAFVCCLLLLPLFAFVLDDSCARFVADAVRRRRRSSFIIYLCCCRCSCGSFRGLRIDLVVCLLSVLLIPAFACAPRVFACTTRRLLTVSLHCFGAGVKTERANKKEPNASNFADAAA